MNQKYKLEAKDIKPLAEGRGACFATNMITKEGYPVRFMYREYPDNEHDSGWRFMSGYESDEYMDNPDNHAIYDVNTIANYDQSIIQFLDAKVGLAFEKIPDADDFELVEDYEVSQGEKMMWPNNAEWGALTQRLLEVDGKRYLLTKVSCGTLKLPSGKLVCCDPFTGMNKNENPFINVPTGEFIVVVTLADVSPELDGSHYREAYASIIFDENAQEMHRKSLTPAIAGEQSEEVLNEGEFIGFSVDAGTACFVDAESLKEGMPDEDSWFDDLFDCSEEKCWFELMDDPKHIREGIANIELPTSKQNNNLILFHSGWGDGTYPVIGGYDASGNLIAVHIDFFVIPDPSFEEEEITPDKRSDKPWWKLW